MNKGIAIGIGIAIIIGGIAAAYSFLGTQDKPQSEQKVELGLGDEAEVTTETPVEEEDEALSVELSVEERIGMTAETP